MSDELNRRRRLVFGAVAACAALGGAGLAWWQQSKDAFGPPDSGGDAVRLGQSGGDAVDGLAAFKLWELTFDTPEGKPLAMASFKGKPLLINFWATWCPPCVEELPLIERFYRENSAKGWQVLGLAVDQKTAVNGFLAKMPLSFPNALAGLSGLELSKSFGNLSGGLPFTVVIGAAGVVLQRKIGLVTPDDLGAWAQLK